MACAALKGISRMTLARWRYQLVRLRAGTFAVTTCADSGRPRKIERKMTTPPGPVGTLLLTRGLMDL
jgi:hypothetical protein